jgi:hypothetical protein
LKYLGECSEEQMVAEFLMGEVKSPRFSDKIKSAAKALDIPLNNVLTPDLLDATQNKDRARLLKKYRGYSTKEGVFGIVPNDVKWQYYELSNVDVNNLHYITYSYWDELSKGTHKVKHGAETVLKNKSVYGQSNEQFYKVAEVINGGAILPPLVLLRHGKFLTIIEGHVRATAIAMANIKDYKIKAIVGTSGHLK